LTATGQSSGLQAQTRFTDAGFDATLQGQSFGSTNWIGGNLTGWEELDYVPVRVLLEGGPESNRVIVVEFDHTSGGGTTPGIQSLTSFSNSPNVVIVSGPTLTDIAGDEWAYTFTIHLTDSNDGFVEFRARLAAGAHNFGGSSLQLKGTPSLGTLQIAKPAVSPGNPDLSVTKSGPSLANPSQTITYIINYANNSNSIATGAQITDVLPGLVTFSNCTDGCMLVGNTLIWDLGELQRNTSGSVSYQVVVDPAALNGQKFTNLATIVSAENDPVTSNNTSRVITTITGGCIPPTIASDPESVTNCAGGSVTFCVAVNGSSPLSFQWRRDGGTIANATNDCLTLDPVGTGDTGAYDCIVANICGSVTSTVANLLFNAPPMITCPGTITSNAEPGQCSATVTFDTPPASGDPTPTVECTPVSGSVFSVGTNTIDCIASNGCGIATCSFDLIVVDNQSPTITCPSDVTVKADAITGLSSGDPVALWVDSSTNANDASQATAANQPTWIASDPRVGNKPTVRFDGVNDFLNAPAVNPFAASGISIFAVANFDIQIPERFVYHLVGTNALRNALLRGRDLGGPLENVEFRFGPSAMGWLNGAVTNQYLLHTMSVGAGPNEYAYYTNGTLIASTDFTFHTQYTNLVIGKESGFTSYLDGDIAELIVFNSVLNAADRQSVNEYLFAKYSIPEPSALALLSLGALLFRRRR
jgi:uncharacterized repeat protein (TIGR01451 family)